MSLRTAACTDTSSEAVGSSRTRSFGSAMRARAMPTRACWPPESWCGRFAEMLGGQPHLGRDFGDAAVVPDARAEAGGDVARRGEGGVERVVGALEDELDGAPRRIAPEARRGHRADVGAVEADRAVARVGEAGDDPRQRRLARAALADHAHAPRPEQG